MKLIGYQKEYNLWLYAFISINFIGAFLMLNSKELLGDFSSLKLYSNNALYIATFLVIVSYFFLQKTLFDFLTKIKTIKIVPIKRIYRRDSLIIGIILFILQFSYMCFNIVEGVNTAGALNLKSSSPFTFIWVLIPVDSIFILYYVFYRNTKFFKYNLLIFIVSNLLRGWTGFFLIIVFFEWCRAYRNNKINFLYIFMFFMLIMLIYPYLLSFKWIIRSLSGANMDITTIISLFKELISNKSYSELFKEGITQLVGRLQQTSVLVEIIHHKLLFQKEFDNSSFLPFWSDGLPQIIYRNIFHITSPPNIGVAIPYYLLPDINAELGSYNISIGYISWIFITPYLIPLYFIYTFSLCFISVMLIKQIEIRQGSFDALWLSWLLYLSAGWLSQFIAFIYAIFVFLILIFISQTLAKIKLKSN